MVRFLFSNWSNGKSGTTSGGHHWAGSKLNFPVALTFKLPVQTRVLEILSCREDASLRLVRRGEGKLFVAYPLFSVFFEASKKAT